MDLTTEYLGLKLAHPIMPGASPFSADLDAVRRLEDAGAPAIVMHSLFEEEILADELSTRQSIDVHAESFAEATSYFPEPPNFRLGPDEYLQHLRKVKEAVSIPVIASLNGHSTRGWMRLARAMEEAGADALELNVYFLATDPLVTAATIEQRTIELTSAIRSQTKLPLAVKLSPFYTSLPNFVMQLAGAGANGVVIFNRFLQPDLDVERLDVVRKHSLSTSADLLLRLRWIAILSNRTPLSLAVTGGVHTAVDALKAIMAGAHAVQMVSELLQHGPETLGRVRTELESWLEHHEYESLAQARGSLDLQSSPDPASFERANYIQILRTWSAPGMVGPDWVHANQAKP